MSAGTPFGDAIHDARWFGVYVGEVINRDDPDQLGRVRFRVPGMMEPSSPWARPLSIGGGAQDRGLFAVPPIGAEVAVWFEQGDPERPLYLAAQWGAPGGESEVPEEARRTPPDACVLATEDFRLEVDNSSSTRKLRLSCVATGDNVIIDAERREIMIAATTRVTIQAMGAVDVDGTTITIGGRPVRLGVEDPI